MSASTPTSPRTPSGSSGSSGPSRRHVLRGAAVAASGAALVAAGQAPPAAAVDGRTPVFVLVHGTHHAGAYFTPHVRELALRGLRAFAVDQPLHGAEAFVPAAYQTQDLKALATEPSPLARLTLDDYERRAVAVVRRAARLGPVVLLGHSMGGLTVSRVADAVPHLLRGIVYMASYCCTPTLPSLVACMEAPESADAVVPPDDVLIGDPDELGVSRINWRTGDPRLLGPLKEMIAGGQPDGAFRRHLTLLQSDEPTEPPNARAAGRPEAFGRVPRTYIRFSRDRLVTPALQDRMIAEWDALTPDNRFAVHTLRAPHIGPLDAGEVVDVLAAVARRTP